MNECPREQESLDLVRSGRWPHGCEDEQRTHIETCEPCGASVQLASMIAEDYRFAARRAPVPASGLVWWRTQRRAREEAARAAARLVTFVQAVSVAVGVGVTTTIVGFDNIKSAVTFASAELASLSLPMAVLLTASLAMAPLAVYLAVRRD